MSKLVLELVSTLDESTELFPCVESITISHQLKKLIVAAYDNIEGWMDYTTLQVFNVVDTDKHLYQFLGRYITKANPGKILMVRDESDAGESLLVFCTKRRSLLKFDMKQLNEEALDDENYSVSPIWTVTGQGEEEAAIESEVPEIENQKEAKPLFGFVTDMVIGVDENGEKLIFVCDEPLNRITIVRYTDGSVVRYLRGGGAGPYSFKSIESIALKQVGQEFTIFVNNASTNFCIVLKGLMSEEIIETKFGRKGVNSTDEDEERCLLLVDEMAKQLLVLGKKSFTLNVLDLETLELVQQHENLPLEYPKDIYIDPESRDLFVSDYRKNSIYIYRR